MNVNNSLVKILENENSFSRVLIIGFPASINMNLLFTPKLENISFVRFENSLSINLINPIFYDFFDSWITAFEQKFNSLNDFSNLEEKFNNEIKGVINLGKKSQEISLNSARGLFGELLELKKLILDDLDNVTEILNSWHRPAPANHDFDFNDRTVELKTISRTSTTVKISSEYQLEAISGKPLFLKVYRIEHVEKSNTDSLGDIYNEILQFLSSEDSIIFQSKCADDEFNKYLGPDYNKLNYKFNVIESFEFFVDQISFPRIVRSQLTSGISKVTYRIDLSLMQMFLL